MAEDATLHETETKTVFASEASVTHCYGLSKHQHGDFLQIIGEALHMTAAICADPDDVLGPDMPEAGYACNEPAIREYP